MKMRTLPAMIDGLRALSDHLRGLDTASPEGALLADAANYIEGATDSLREHMQMLTEMRVRLEQMRPLMEEAAKELEEFYDMYRSNQHQYQRDMELPRAIRAMLRWWEPGTAEPASISHWGIVK
jgi:hypothetical protein